MSAVILAIHQDRDRDRTRRVIKEAQRLKVKMLDQVIQKAPDEGLRRQARMYKERLEAGMRDEH